MHTREQLRGFVAPSLNAYEVRRLLLVGGCLAAAAAANYAGSALPQRVPVAIGAALVGILLVLRRHPGPHAEHVDDAGADGAPQAEERVRKTRRSHAGRDVPTQLLALAASLEAAERELEAHENRLTSLSGRQSLLHVEARDKLADFDARLEQLEARVSETEELTRMIRGHHLDMLRRLHESLARHREALVGLADRT